MGLVCHELGFGSDLASVLFRYYLLRASERKALAKELSVLAHSEEAAGTASARFSAKLNENMFHVLEEVEKASKLKRAEVVKGVILQAKKDILDDRLADVRRQLVTAMQLAG
jgi:hypothetical protein